jgi:PHP family Zn ribbon phosphoesterase
MTPLDVRCPHCGAKPGKKCIGRVEHVVRLDKMRAAERIAYRKACALEKATLRRIHQDAFKGAK